MTRSLALRRHSAVLVAHATELRQVALDACQRGAACREMGRLAVVSAVESRVRADAARKRQDAR